MFILSGCIPYRTMGTFAQRDNYLRDTGFEEIPTSDPRFSANPVTWRQTVGSEGTPLGTVRINYTFPEATNREPIQLTNFLTDNNF